MSSSLILFPSKEAQIGGHRTLQGRQMSAALTESGAEQEGSCGIFYAWTSYLAFKYLFPYSNMLGC